MPRRRAAAWRSATTVRGGPRLGTGSLRLWRTSSLRERHGPRPIVGANAGEGGDARENHRPRRLRLEEVLGPEPGGTAVAGFEDDRRAARAPAFHVSRRPPPMSTRPAKSPCAASATGEAARGAQGDGEQEDGDGQGGGCMTKLKRTHDQLPWLPMMRRVSRNLPHRGQDACELDDVENGGKLLSFRL